MKRDKTLDCLRGIAIIQVVFVHVLYWLPIFNGAYSSIIKSFFLFEMPIFFFVTGAVNGLGKKVSYKVFCSKRIKGILIPYYVYSVICVAISFVFYIVHNQLSVKLTIKLLLTWLIPLNLEIMPLPYFAGALWFVPVYIITIILFPMVKTVLLKFRGKMVILSILVFLVVEYGCFFIRQNTTFGTTIYTNTLLCILQETFFYLIFMALGALYPQLKVRTKKQLRCTAGVLFLCIMGLISCKFIFHLSLNMQNNKFPPNYIFLMFAFIVLSLIYLAYPLLKNIYYGITTKIPLFDRFVMNFSKNSLYVFLYQSFSFFIASKLMEMLGLHNEWAIFATAIITVYPIILLIITIIINIKKIALSSHRQ